MGPLGRVAAIGGSGFIASHLVGYGRSLDIDISVVPIPHVSGLSPGPVPGAADTWRRITGGAFADLCRSLEPFDVVINAAGSASPGGTDTSALFSSNTALPAIIAQAARAAGVRRLVHVSTAAVQGRLDPLDETARHSPLSPYAASKAGGELFLLDAEWRDDRPGEVVVYRPTSVQGRGQESTRRFARMIAALPAVPVAGSGDQPVPVSLIENVAAGILFAAGMTDVRSIILQPSEEMTARSLLELFGATRIVHLPPKMSRLALQRIGRMAYRSPGVTARLRWCELLFNGQQVQADALSTAGFAPVAGYDGWVALARHERSLREFRPVPGAA